MDTFIPIIFIVLVLLLFVRNKWKAAQIKKEGFHTTGEVTGYENKFMRVGGTWTWLDYPTVVYKDRYGKTRTGFIKKAKSGGRYYNVDAKVEIVVHDGTIYPKDSL
ncbi:hypothetical protein E1176_19780 [Fulvivirga sp. RKSG066]|uniref:hypothetical protein n=1 Tax=Fulvivirga aurantia TaxID=2529383 RepID=UPI0012BC3B43|nr:hypothetical protein [Fulvivirga aurantia]MTI23279.1 hypothetical protein [Fulvivirga aurantia]